MKGRHPKIFLVIFIILLFVGQIIYLPSLGEVSGFPIDKIYHFLTAVLLFLAFYFVRYSLMKSFLLALLLEGLGEIIQIPIPWRSASWADFSVEVVGIILTIGLLIGYNISYNS